MLTMDGTNPNKIFYKGVCIAELREISGRTVVEIKLSYEASSDDWVVLTCP